MGALGFVHGAQRGTGEAIVGDFDIPLIGEVGFDGYVAAVAVTDGVGVGFDVVEQVVGAEPGDDGFAGFEAVHADQVGGFVNVLFDLAPAVVVANGSIGAHDVNDAEIMSLADFPVVGIVGGSDF